MYLDQLEYNVKSNEKIIKSRGSAVAESLDWNDENVTLGDCNILLAADCVYYKEVGSYTVIWHKPFFSSRFCLRIQSLQFCLSFNFLPLFSVCSWLNQHNAPTFNEKNRNLSQPRESFLF